MARKWERGRVGGGVGACRSRAEAVRSRLGGCLMADEEAEAAEVDAAAEAEDDARRKDMVSGKRIAGGADGDGGDDEDPVLAWVGRCGEAEVGERETICTARPWLVAAPSASRQNLAEARRSCFRRNGETESGCSSQA